MISLHHETPTGGAKLPFFYSFYISFKNCVYIIVILRCTSSFFLKFCTAFGADFSDLTKRSRSLPSRSDHQECFSLIKSHAQHVQYSPGITQHNTHTQLCMSHTFIIIHGSVRQLLWITSV